MRHEHTPTLNERAPLVAAVRMLEVAQRDVAANAAPDPFHFMTMPQAFLFQYVLWAPNGVPQATLVEHLHTTPAAVSQMVRRMARIGLVRLDKHPTDGRCTLVVATEKGREQYAWVSSTIASRDRQWHAASSRRHTHAEGLDAYVRGGLALWKWDRGLTSWPYATGLRAS